MIAENTTGEAAFDQRAHPVQDQMCGRTSINQIAEKDRRAVDRIQHPLQAISPAMHIADESDRT